MPRRSTRSTRYAWQAASGSSGRRGGPPPHHCRNRRRWPRYTFLVLGLYPLRRRAERTRSRGSIARGSSLGGCSGPGTRGALSTGGASPRRSTTRTRSSPNHARSTPSGPPTPGTFHTRRLGSHPRPRNPRTQSRSSRVKPGSNSTSICRPPGSMRTTTVGWDSSRTPYIPGSSGTAGWRNETRLRAPVLAPFPEATENRRFERPTGGLRHRLRPPCWRTLALTTGRTPDPVGLGADMPRRAAPADTAARDYLSARRKRDRSEAKLAHPEMSQWP